MDLIGPRRGARDWIGPGGRERDSIGPDRGVRDLIGPSGEARGSIGPGGRERELIGPGGGASASIGPGLQPAGCGKQGSWLMVEFLVFLITWDHSQESTFP